MHQLIHAGKQLMKHVFASRLNGTVIHDLICLHQGCDMAALAIIIRLVNADIIFDHAVKALLLLFWHRIPDQHHCIQDFGPSQPVIGRISRYISS